MRPRSEMTHERASRESMNASVAATTQATTLAHNGIRMPFTVTSHPNATRSNCNSATSEKTTTATVVKGFTRNLRKVGQSRVQLVGFRWGPTKKVEPNSDEKESVHHPLVVQLGAGNATKINRKGSIGGT